MTASARLHTTSKSPSEQALLCAAATHCISSSHVPHHQLMLGIGHCLHIEACTSHMHTHKHTLVSPNDTASPSMANTTSLHTRAIPKCRSPAVKGFYTLALHALPKHAHTVLVCPPRQLTDGWNACDRLSQLELVKNTGLAGCIQPCVCVCACVCVCVCVRVRARVVGSDEGSAQLITHLHLQQLHADTPAHQRSELESSLA